ncbi:unnamed protein product [Gongylonema pulchrum]|uniref:Cytokin_check_N domain-containing protein n=1 Tax=Gongylonema pulchrum TaxID=637853 RepID=A0A183EBQ9_9BILA|nr:unnamed protein product [Gongylonema pulchrum]
MKHTFCFFAQLLIRTAFFALRLSFLSFNVEKSDLKKLAEVIEIIVDRHSPNPILLSALPQIVGNVYGSPVNPEKDQSYRTTWRALVKDHCGGKILIAPLPNGEFAIFYIVEAVEAKKFLFFLTRALLKLNNSSFRSAPACKYRLPAYHFRLQICVFVVKATMMR